MELMWLSVVFDVVNLVLVFVALYFIVVVRSKLNELADMLKKEERQVESVENKKTETGGEDIRKILVLYGKKVGL